MKQTAINDLQPIVAPEAVSFWPPQPGWYLVLILLLAALSYLFYRWVRFKKRNAYRKVALEQMAGISSSVQDLARLNKLLKVTAIQGFGRRQVAGLYGPSWIEFLNASCTRVNFTEEEERIITQASWRNIVDLEFAEQSFLSLKEKARKWITYHKVKRYR